MRGSSGDRVATTSDWVRGHPFLAMTLGMALSLLIGLGMGVVSGKAKTKSLEAKLSRAVERSAEAGGKAKRLGDENASLKARVQSLEAEADDLENAVVTLKARRPLPRLVGTFSRRAIALERIYGWTLSVAHRYSDARPGTVLHQTPAANTMMNYGAPFRIVVAKEVPTMPDLVGMNKDSAIHYATSLRYEVDLTEQIGGGKAGRIVGQSPSPGTELLPGGAVSLIVSVEPPAPPPMVVSSSCKAGFVTAAAVDAMHDTHDDLNPTFFNCSSVEEWIAGAKSTRGLGIIPDRMYVRNRCLYAGAVKASPVCSDL